MRLIDIDELRDCAIIRPMSRKDMRNILSCSNILIHTEIPTAYDIKHEQEIRDNVVKRIIERIEEARQKYQRLCREQGENEDEVMNIHFRGIVKIIKEASKNAEEIEEQMKEVGE